jgi:hypothetical protein
MPEVKEIISDAHRVRFRDRYGSLRMRNKLLSDEQTHLRKQRKPSRGLINKDPDKALEITVLLRLMKKMKGQSLKYRPPCRLCGHIDEATPERDIHALPTDEWGKQKAARIEDEIIRELELDEFLK